ncbi:MAG: aldehyde dehydrogenase family protein [Arachidicoccus sp.]|nr:aldehyde dehydrogenase family protein [Arachidicoccus sp.]
MSKETSIGERIGAETKRFLAKKNQLLFINGKFVPAKSGKTFDTINPATEEILGSVAEAGAEDVDEAVKAARKAFEAPTWSGINPHERARYLLKLADAIAANADTIAEIETLDTGVPLSINKANVIGNINVLQYYAGWCSKIYGKTNPSADDVFNYTRREPLGVCGQITPWNAPFNMVIWKIAPALACGNTVVLKPAENTPLSAIKIAELIQEVGFPEGVVNIIPGMGSVAGSAMTTHPDINKIAFTGSTNVGKGILSGSVDTLKKITLELGGKSPNIIFSDADLDKAITTAVNGFTLLSGQACIAGTRVFVQDNIYDEVVKRISQKVSELIVGDPFNSTTQLGPLISEKQFKQVSSYFDIGKKDGAKITVGGKRFGDKGYYVEPTVFTNVDNQMRIAKEEIFGPVGSIISFKDENDVIAQANNTPYGLAAGVWTKDISRGHRIAHAIKSGMVWINSYFDYDPISPFGGYKQSGMGREFGEESIDAYTQIKSIFLRY